MILMKGTPLHHNKGSSRSLGPCADSTMGHIKDYLVMRIWASSSLARILQTAILVGSNMHSWTQYAHPPSGSCHTSSAKKQELSQALQDSYSYKVVIWLLDCQRKNGKQFMFLQNRFWNKLWYCFLPVFSHFLLSVPQSFTFDILSFSSCCHKQLSFFLCFSLKKTVAFTKTEECNCQTTSFLQSCKSCLIIFGK